MENRIHFLGCPVDNLDINDTLSWMELVIKKRVPSRISVVNANKFWQMSKDTKLTIFVKGSELIIPEWAVYWGAGVMGTPLKSPVYGISLVKAVLPWAEKKEFSIFFLGAKPEVLNSLESNLNKTFPLLKIAGLQHGYFKTEEENNNLLRKIKKCNPDILFVAMGSPRQEYWMFDNLNELNVPIAIGVGGSFDVIAGLKSDTPSWARGHGLEWIYRLSQDPKTYWKRYLITNPWFVWQIIKLKFLKIGKIKSSLK